LRQLPGEVLEKKKEISIKDKKPGIREGLRCGLGKALGIEKRIKNLGMRVDVSQCSR